MDTTGNCITLFESEEYSRISSNVGTLTIERALRTCIDDRCIGIGISFGWAITACFV